MCTGIRLLLPICSFISSCFILFNFQPLKCFVTRFSGTVRPRRLKLGTHMDSGQMYRVYQTQVLLLIHPFITSVFFLFNFQTLKTFVALFTGTVRPIKLKLDTHMEIGWMYHVYRNQAASSYLSLISLFFFLSNVKKLKIFVTLFSGTVRPRKFKLGTLVDNGWMYRVYQNQAAALTYSFISLYFFNFLSLQLSNIRIFRHTFLRNCEA